MFGLFHPQEVILESPQSLLLKAGEREAALSGQGVEFRVASSRIRVTSGKSQFTADEVRIAPRQGGEGEFYLSIPGKIRRMFRGQLTLTVRGRELVPIVSMELETAVASIVAAELPGDTPMETLKAQAVLTRSYLLAGRPRHPYSDFCDTTHCQFLKSPPKFDSGAAKAALATTGLVLAWEGRPFAAMYSASCGGRTHSLAEIGYTQRDYPYFAVECPYCLRHPERWYTALREDEASALAKSHSEAQRIALGRKLGWSAVPSGNFSSKSAGGTVDLAGVGRGHGLGLCQRGASGLAREGKDFRAILAHYFPNTSLESVSQEK